MKQKFTILFDLDGTLVDTAPDLMLAHNHVMKKFGYPTKSTEDIRNLVGKGGGDDVGQQRYDTDNHNGSECAFQLDNCRQSDQRILHRRQRSRSAADIRSQRCFLKNFKQNKERNILLFQAVDGTNETTKGFNRMSVAQT